MNSSFRHSNVKTALLLGAATSAIVCGVQIAQAQETVTVTGTRIVNRDFASDSPISTVSGDLIQATGAIEVTDLLATLPQVVPSISAGSNNPGNGGQQQIDLRGLGPQRAVVLIDGRRAAPSNDDGTVDLQTIPTSLISRVEVITGGASAVYGPDAITGVVNFIMKKDFSGVATDFQYGVSDRGDGNTLSASLTVGGNFDGGKGNMVFSYDYGYRRELFDSARPFANQATTSTSRSPTGSYAVEKGALNRPSQAAVNAYFAAHGGAPAGTVSNLSTFGFNDDGTLFNFGGANGSNQVYNYKSDLSYPARLFCADPTTPTNCKSYSYNFQPPNLLVLPLKRQNFMTIGHYDVTPDIEVYVEGRFTNYNSAQSLAPTPAPTKGGTTIDGGSYSSTGYIVPAGVVVNGTTYNNPFIPADLRTLLNSRTGDSALPGTGATEDFLLNTRFLALGPRLDVFNNSIFQETAGLRGKLPFTNLDFDVFASYGQLDTIETQFGNVSNSAVEAILFGNGASVGCGDNNGYSDLNPFGRLKFGPKSLACISRVTKNSTHTTFTDVEGTVSGSLFDMPAGAAKFSLGMDYRENTYTFLADPLLSSGDISGFTASTSENGATYDQEAFGELYLPLIKDAPWADFVSVTLGARYTEQAKTFHGNAWTWKAEGDWGIMPGVTARGSFQVATRMPNISELFSASFSDSPGLGNPCNFDSPFRTGANAAQVTALCKAFSANVGSATFQQVSGQATVISGGNSKLKPETADTFTLGLGYQSNMHDPWLSGISATLDYWNIDLHSPIGIDAFDILYGCFNYDGSNPSYSKTNAACSATGHKILSMTSLYISGFETNLAKYQLDGLDLALNWHLNLEDTIGADPMWGSLDFNLAGTYLMSYSVQGSPTGRSNDYAGTVGVTSPIGLNTDSAYPTTKGSLTVTWAFLQKASFSARFDYIDAMRNELDILGWTGKNLGIGPVKGTSATTYIDLFGSYALTDYLTLRGGINNVADIQPRSYNPSQQDGTDPATYDILGRRFFVGLNLKF
ncbi:MAG: TonB-dependent receptor [Alphaproteobacteria bacterium]|nr:TonB-dependent receptor [Alphaproteobacteria bacterium]